MNNLTQLQKKFQQYLMQSNQAIENDIEETKSVSTKTRLEIYSNAYDSRLVQALSSNYPILQKYLGHDQFQELAHIYIHNYPSTFRSIRWFGDKLENFLLEDDNYKDYPFLSELAKLEWVMTLTFDATDFKIIDNETVMSVNPDQWQMMSFLPHPSVHIISFQWNIVQIWQSLSQDKKPCDLVKNDFPVYYVFWRKELINQYCSLPDDEKQALVSMFNGMTFGDICADLCQWYNEQEAAIRAASLLKGWINSGLISGIEIK